MLPRFRGGREQLGVQALKARQPLSRAPNRPCEGSAEAPTSKTEVRPAPAPPGPETGLLDGHLWSSRDQHHRGRASHTHLSGSRPRTQESQSREPLPPPPPAPLFRDRTGQEPHRNKTQADACTVNGTGAICPANRINSTKATQVLLPPGKALSSLILSLRSAPAFAGIRPQLQPKPRIKPHPSVWHVLPKRSRSPGLSRRRSQGRCCPPRPAGPGWGSSHLSPTAPGARLGAPPGGQTRGLPGSPARACPAGCS